MHFLTSNEANQFLRFRRANSGFEEMSGGNLEQECIEENCVWEEAREIFEIDTNSLNVFWNKYTAPPTTAPPPEPQGHKAESGDGAVPAEASSQIIYIIIPIIIIVLLIIAIVFFCIRKKRRQRERKSAEPFLDPHNVNRHLEIGGSFSEYQVGKGVEHSSSARSQTTASSGSSAPPPYDTIRSNDSGVTSGTSSRSNFVMKDKRLESAVKECFIQRKQLELGELLKEGNFGAVYRGRLNNHGRMINVAVKTLKQLGDRSAFEEFMREGVIMKDFNHGHVLSLIGVCVDGPNETPMLLLPFCELGDLRAYLRNAKNVVVVADLVRYCHEMCQGMEYLASKNFIHRDLAARNCMVDKNLTLKVSDFGLSRTANNRDYYRSQRTQELPLKWMAPESIKFNYYTEKSDSWAFGVTCWEVMTRACIPYPTVEPLNILKYLESDNRMEKPTHCPTKLYDIMKQCWAAEANDRPTFSEMRPHLDDILNQRRTPEKKRETRHSEPFPKRNSSSITNPNQIERSKTEAINKPHNSLTTSPRYVASPFSTADRSRQKSNGNSRTQQSLDRRDRPKPKERSQRPR